MIPALAGVSTRLLLGMVFLCCALTAVSAADGGPTAIGPSDGSRTRSSTSRRRRRAMAQHWRSLTPARHREFLEAFSDLLERACMPKIELYSGEKILYPGERVEGDVTTVSTRIIKGVSLVANYRTQFNSVIRTSSYDELLRKMRSRVEEVRP